MHLDGRNIHVVHTADPTLTIWLTMGSAVRTFVFKKRASPIPEWRAANPLVIPAGMPESSARDGKRW